MGIRFHQTFSEQTWLEGWGLSSDHHLFKIEYKFLHRRTLAPHILEHQDYQFKVGNRHAQEIRHGVSKNSKQIAETVNDHGLNRMKTMPETDGAADQVLLICIYITFKSKIKSDQIASYLNMRKTSIRSGYGYPGYQACLWTGNRVFKHYARVIETAGIGKNLFLRWQDHIARAISIIE